MGLTVKGYLTATLLIAVSIGVIFFHTNSGYISNAVKRQTSDEITPIKWLEWQPWRCFKLITDGCFRERERACATGSLQDCQNDPILKGRNETRYDIKPCANGECPDYPCIDKPEANCTGLSDILLHTLCNNNEAKHLCPKTCALCVPETPCINNPHGIQHYPCSQSLSLCKSEQFALEHCPKTCGKCEGGCYDDPGCILPNFRDFACNDPDLDWKLCPRACGLCDLSTSTIKTTLQTTVKAQQTTTTGVTTQPTTSKVTTQPTTSKVTTQPTTSKVMTQPTTSKVTTQPTTSKVTTQPTTSKGTTQPTTKKVTTQPTTSKVTTQPTTIKVTTQPPTTKVTTVTYTTTKPTTDSPTTIQATTAKPQVGGNTNPVQCAVCSGPPQLCEKIYRTESCTPPNNYCINHIINNNFGGKMVNRTCGTFGTCYREWFQGSSDNERCQKFDASQVVTSQFECTFCCVDNDCNVPLKPAKDSLYNDV